MPGTFRAKLSLCTRIELARSIRAFTLLIVSHSSSDSKTALANLKWNMNGSCFYLSIADSRFRALIYLRKQFIFHFLPPLPLLLCTQFRFAFLSSSRSKNNERKKKNRNLFSVCRLRFKFLLPSSVLFIGKHSFIIYHGDWDGDNFMLGPVKRREILANLIIDKSVISFSAPSVESQTHIISPTQELCRDMCHENHPQVSGGKVQDKILRKVIKLSLSWTFFAAGSLLAQGFPRTRPNTPFRFNLSLWRGAKPRQVIERSLCTEGEMK